MVELITSINSIGQYDVMNKIIINIDKSVNQNNDVSFYALIKFNDTTIRISSYSNHRHTTKIFIAVAFNTEG
jgi:hypothetical protein